MNSRMYFDKIAKQWNHIRKDYFKDDIRPLILERLDFKDKTVADLGSGTGYFALEAAKQAKLVFALDQSEVMLKELLSKAEDQGLSNIYALRSQLGNEWLLMNQIDIASMHMSLHHMQKPWDIFKSVYQFLSADGQLIISDVSQHHGSWAYEEMHDVWLGFDLQDIRQWLEDAGFIDIRVEMTPYKAHAQSSKGEEISPHIWIATARKGE